MAKGAKSKGQEAPAPTTKPRRSNGFQPDWKRKRREAAEAERRATGEPEEEFVTEINREEKYVLPEIDLKVDGTNVTVERLVLTPELVAVAIYQSRGMLSVAARKLGTTVRTVKQFVANEDICALAAEEANEMLLDFAEAKLFQKIKAGDIASIIFFLRTRGKGRGYTEKASTADEEAAKQTKAQQKLDADARETAFRDRLKSVGENIKKAIDINSFAASLEEDDASSDEQPE